jgi:hypothetical protein
MPATKQAKYPAGDNMVLHPVMFKCGRCPLPTIRVFTRIYTRVSFPTLLPSHLNWNPGRCTFAPPNRHRHRCRPCLQHRTRNEAGASAADLVAALHWRRLLDVRSHLVWFRGTVLWFREGGKTRECLRDGAERKRYRSHWSAVRQGARWACEAHGRVEFAGWEYVEWLCRGCRFHSSYCARLGCCCGLVLVFGFIGFCGWVRWECDCDLGSNFEQNRIRCSFSLF